MQYGGRSRTSLVSRSYHKQDQNSEIDYFSEEYDQTVLPQESDSYASNDSSEQESSSSSEDEIERAARIRRTVPVKTQYASKREESDEDLGVSVRKRRQVSDDGEDYDIDAMNVSTISTTPSTKYVSPKTEVPRKRNPFSEVKNPSGNAMRRQSERVTGRAKNFSQESQNTDVEQEKRQYIKENGMKEFQVLSVTSIVSHRKDDGAQLLYQVYLVSDRYQEITEAHAKAVCPRKMKAYHRSQEHIDIDEDEDEVKENVQRLNEAYFGLHRSHDKGKGKSKRGALPQHTSGAVINTLSPSYHIDSVQKYTSSSKKKGITLDSLLEGL